MMHYMYEADGRYIGHVEHESECCEAVNHTSTAPGEIQFASDNIYKPLNWPYWTGSAWEMRTLEE